jgi:hypothetical protein
MENQKQTIKSLCGGFYASLPSYKKTIELTKRCFLGEELSEEEKTDYYEARRKIFSIVEYALPKKDRLRMLKKLFLTPTGSNYSQKIEERRLLRAGKIVRRVYCLEKTIDPVLV